MQTNRKYCRRRAFQMRIEPFSRQPRKCCHMAHRSGQGVRENNLPIPTVDRSVLCRKKYSDLASQTTKVDGIGTNRAAMHHAPALKRIAGCSLQARRQLSAWRGAAAAGAQPFQQLQTQRHESILTRQPLNKGSAAAKKHPNPHATARLVAHFSRKTAERKVTHITNKFFKPLILILLMETPEAPRREKSPKACNIL